MSRRRQNKNGRQAPGQKNTASKEFNERTKQNPNQDQEQPSFGPQIAPEAPATEKQRAMLRLAIQKNWLNPNPFDQNYPKWEKLTAGEADGILASIPPERLGVLEHEIINNREKRLFEGKGISRSIGRGLEDGVKQIGHAIDGGIS